MLARQREAVLAVVRRRDDDEQCSVGPLDDFLKAPGVTDAAPAIVDVRQEGDVQRTVGPARPRQAGAAGLREITVELAAQLVRVRDIAATGVPRRPDRGAHDLAKA